MRRLVPPSVALPVYWNGKRYRSAPGSGSAPIASSSAMMWSAAWRIPSVPVSRPSNPSEASASTLARMDDGSGAGSAGG